MNAVKPCPCCNATGWHETECGMQTFCAMCASTGDAAKGLAPVEPRAEWFNSYRQRERDLYGEQVVRVAGQPGKNVGERAGLAGRGVL